MIEGRWSDRRTEVIEDSGGDYGRADHQRAADGEPSTKSTDGIGNSILELLPSATLQFIGVPPCGIVQIYLGQQRRTPPLKRFKNIRQRLAIKETGQEDLLQSNVFFQDGFREFGVILPAKKFNFMIRVLPEYAARSRTQGLTLVIAAGKTF